MKKSIGLLFCIISCSSIRAHEQKTALTAYLEKNVRIGMAAAIGICLAYEGYKWYTSPEEAQPDGQDTIQEKKPITLNDRIEYFGIGAGYSLLTVASILATYKCAVHAVDRLNALIKDPVKEWHNLYDEDGLSKSGKKWEEGLEFAREVKKRWLLGSAFAGSFALAIPYFTYVRYRLPHAAIENLKKAFQN